MAITGIQVGSGSITFSVDIDMKGLDKQIKSGAFIKTLNKHLHRGFLGFGSWAKGRVRHQMMNNNYPGNMGIQRYLKRGDKVLIDTRGIYRNINFEYVKIQGVSGVIVGVKEGYSQYGGRYSKIVPILQEGATFVPSAAQRKAVFALSNESGAPKKDKDAPPKTVWEIPARPFITDAMTARDTNDKFVTIVGEALDKALTELMK